MLLAAFAFVIALLMGTAAASLLSRNRSQEEMWTGTFPIVLLIFLAIWAGGLWITPVGPTLWGVAWLPLFFVGLIMALFWASIGVSANATQLRPTRPAQGPGLQATDRNERHAQAAAGILSIFFWALLVILMVPILSQWF